METANTKDIVVMVQSFYEAEHSNPMQKKFVFSYHVIIENLGRDSVQLLSRHWKIVDGTLNLREVKGDGVIGKQPILHPGENHSYDSWCPLPTDSGKMYGSFQMINTHTQEKFDIEIPEFKLIATFKNN